MESKFTTRFKASAKIRKSTSIFENLIPIEKDLKDYKIHPINFFSNRVEEATNFRKLKNNFPSLNVNSECPAFLPEIINHDSAKSHSRVLSTRSRDNFTSNSIPLPSGYRFRKNCIFRSRCRYLSRQKGVKGRAEGLV